MDHYSAFMLSNQRPPATPALFRVVLLTQLGFLGFSVALAAIAVYFAGDLPFRSALALLAAGGATATLAWRYMVSLLNRMDDEGVVRAKSSAAERGAEAQTEAAALR
jgi:hypothetical protein